MSEFFDFKSTFVTNEIDLNSIAVHFGINKKFKWDEPLVLDEHNLEGIILKPLKKAVFLFHFGSIVFVNLTYHEMQDIIKYLNNIDENIDSVEPFLYSEDFKLEVKEDASPAPGELINFEIRYNSAVVVKLNNYTKEIVATIIAKSVALEKVEHDINILLDEIENLIEYLDKGRFKLGDRQLAKLSSKILRYKYNSISYLMLLDKPDVAWKYEKAEEFYIELSNLFELKDRYENIKNKSEILLDITEVFTGLTHSKRGNLLEWAVIILIAFELIIAILEALI